MSVKFLLLCFALSQMDYLFTFCGSDFYGATFKSPRGSCSFTKVETDSLELKGIDDYGSHIRCFKNIFCRIFLVGSLCLKVTLESLCSIGVFNGAALNNTLCSRNIITTRLRHLLSYFRIEKQTTSDFKSLCLRGGD